MADAAAPGTKRQAADEPAQTSGASSPHETEGAEDAAGEFVKPKGERRRGKKLKHKLESGTATREQYFDVYGPDARATLERTTEAGGPGTPLKYRDLQDLVLWVLTDLVKKPTWIFVKNKPLVRGALVLTVPELNVDVYRQHSGALSQLGAAFGAPVFLTAPGSNTHVYPPLQTLLRIQKGRSGSHHRHHHNQLKELAQPLPAAEFVLSAQQLAANNYPTEDSDPDYVRTSDRSRLVSGSSGTDDASTPIGVQPVVAVDCEMVITEAGYELARATYVDQDGTVLYDQVIRPPRPVLDHVTRFSGITAEMLSAATHTLEDAQRAFLQLVVVGHSLENDLRAMRMIHHRVADTALLFADDRGTSYKPSLRHLAERHLKIQIQQDSHDSETDAVTALRLLELKQRYGPDYGVQREDDGESLYLALQAAQRKTSVVGKSAALSRVDVPIGASDLVETTSDAETLRAALHCTNKGADFVFALLDNLCIFDDGDRSHPSTATEGPSLEARLRELDDQVAQQFAAVPPNTLVMVVSGQPNTRRVSEIRARRKSSEGLSEEDTAALRQAVNAARATLAFVTIKQ